MKLHEINLPGLVEPIAYKIGQNAHENTALVVEGQPSDLWFHIDGTSSAHVVVRLPSGIDRKQRGKIIKQGALLCKQHTAKMKGVKDVPIVYTTLQFVEATDVPGSVLTTNTQIIRV